MTLAFGVPIAEADDLAPTTEQVTERSQGLTAVWDVLRERTAGLRIRGRQELLSSGEFDGARLAWLRTEIGLQAGMPIGDRVTLGLAPSFAWERLSIDGSDDFIVAQGGRDVRFTDFHDAGLRLGASYLIDDSWTIEAVTGWSVTQESGADVRDASQVGGSLAVAYRRGGWLRLRLGVGVGADLDDREPRISPVYRIVIRPTPDWSIESSGLGARVEWRATPRTALSLGAKKEGTQYRLDRRGEPPANSGDGTFQRRQTRLELGAAHRLSKRWRLRAGFGLVLDEELEVADEDGVTTDRRQERDPSVTAAFGVEMRL